MAFKGTVTSDFLKNLTSPPDYVERLIDYSSSDYATIRDSLINYAKAAYPLDYNNFSESDFGIFLIELMAAVGHIQSFKSDFLANENYIRTARQRKSIKKMLELIGIRMKGPISAAANALIQIQADIPNVSSVRVPVANRTVSIASPEDGGSVSYTLYKVNSNGLVDLESKTTELNFIVSSDVNNNINIRDAVLLEGSLVVETGQFTSEDLLKSVTLSQFPYVERSAQIYIEGNPLTTGIYKEEENLFFASGSSDKIFQVVTDDSFKAKILFGDSSISLTPSIGDVYTITYRIGGGTRGNIANEVINSPISVIVKSASTEKTNNGTLQNVSEGTGGADPESIIKAKKYAPLSFRRQDRIVTLSDYKTFANTFISNYGSTGKANAVVRRAYSSANIIDLFVLEKASDTQLRKATPEYKRQLLEAIEDKKMLTDEPVVVDGLIRTLDIFVTINIEKKFKLVEQDIINKVRNKIFEYFNIDNAEFGETFDPQDLVRFILDINEVRFATIDNIDLPIVVDFNEIIQINNFTINSVII
jgi:hypothetical protein